MAHTLDLNGNEEAVLGYWKEHDVLRKTREKNRGRKPFYFLDGPPFVSGDLHPGQMWVKSMKDVILRYKRFRGYDVYDRAGYDVHGLPIEKRAEAQLGIKSKKEIEERIGVEKFINTCKEYVEAYIGRMDKDYYRFGMSLDFSNPYIPSKMPYMEVAWSYLKRMDEKGFLYKDRRATTYCTSCGTSVSQGSMEVEYRNDTDPSVFVSFEVDGKGSEPRIEIGSNLKLLVWTTTPWTLPANVAVAVNPDEKYVIARIGNERYVLIGSRLDAVAELLKESAVVESEFYGVEMEGIRYISPLEANVPKQKELRKYHRVVMSKELVSSTEGSGIVHIAPGHGLEDYLIGKRNRLPIFSPVDRQGSYTNEAGKYGGLSVPSEANKAVLDDLKSLGALVHSSTILHSYPHCWRCDTKLIYIATEQWFINIQKVKKKLISENRKVSWHPQEALKWQEDVLQSSPDWAVSRQRYWGIPMPVWECGTCDSRVVVGSVKELRDAADNKEYVDSLTDIHMPYIDKVEIKCSKCSTDTKRVKDVLDVWFDSSIAYRAGLTEEQFNLLFPMDFILEAIEQLRGWFSYQLKSSVIVHGRRPFKNVVMHGMMLGSDGREMHKKIGNYVPLNDILKTVTADSFRIWCTSHTPQLDLIFSMDKISEANRAVITLYNISNLLQEYSDAVAYKPRKIKSLSQSWKLDAEDAWIISRLNSTIYEVTESLDRYEIYKAVNAIRSFMIIDLSRFYLKIAKKKILYAGRKSSKSTIDILNHVLFSTLIMIAPIAPFAAEKIYLDRYAFKESIFLEDWPKARKGAVNQEIEGHFEVAIGAITAILSSREKSGVKLRWPLAKATIETSDEKAAESMDRLAHMIEDYTNVKGLVVKRVGRSNAEARPNFARIGPDFKENAAAIAEAIKSANANELMEAIGKTGEYSLHTSNGTFAIKADHFIAVERFDNPDAVQFKHGIAYVDKEVSQELQDEAMLREFERRVQLARKEMGLGKGDKIRISYRVSDELHVLINSNIKQVKSDLNASEVARFESVKAALVKKFDLESEEIEIGIDRA